METIIYIITHKKFDCPKLKGYKPLHVGRHVKEDLGYKGDNTGDNISSKNANFCELTGIYWIWKNDKTDGNVGIVHYRRYFTKGIFSKKRFLKINDIEKILENNDIIMPKKEVYGETATEQYCRNSGFKEDIQDIRNILEQNYPDYIESYDKIMNNNKMYQYNMLICNKEKYDEYCKWLFDILFKFEKNVDLSKRNDYQKRIYGFLSERLLNVWVDKNKLKIKEIRVVNTEEKLTTKLRNELRRYKNALRFKIKKINN